MKSGEITLGEKRLMGEGGRKGREGIYLDAGGKVGMERI